MTRRVSLLIVACAAIIPWGRSAGTETSALTPRIGETSQEFDARQRGIKLTRSSSDVVTVAADRRGHFYVAPTLNGQTVRMMVDTGASVVALAYEDAERIGAQLSSQDFTAKMSTANGVVAGAPFLIGEIKVGELTVKNVEAVVLPKGRLDTSLLGMSFLKRLSGFDISQGRLNLRN